MNGWIILDKPLGLGSTQAVSAVKRALRSGGYPKVKVGHGGTLDPLATGVLPIALGEATKLAGRMLESDKTYDFTIAFGTITDTLDAQGAVVAMSDVRPSLAQVEAIFPRFTGPISQMPPAYSALKIEGKRAYDLARTGEAVVLKARDVVVYSLSVRPDSERTASLEHLTLTAHVSKGTYIRSLARDIAQALGTVGHVTMLRRTKAGPFSVDDTISLDKLKECAMSQQLEACLLPLRAALADIPVLALSPDQADALRKGRSLAGIAASDGLAFAHYGEALIALVQIASGDVKVERGFNM